MATVLEAPANQVSAKPAAAKADFHARDVDFKLDPKRVTDWCGDVWHSLYFNALSITFPIGERFFISSVAHYLPQIKNPKLRAEVSAFIQQEALHTREHIEYNKAIETVVDVAAMEKELSDHIEFVKKKLPPLHRLAVTAALEHFTAIMAKDSLESKTQLANAEPRYAQLWTWHALEECEHKAVAYDVFQTVTEGKKNGMRRRIMVLVTLNFITRNARFMTKMMKAQGYARNPIAWAKLLWSIFGNPGPIRRIIPNYLKYYKANFHPNDINDEATLARTKALVDSWA